MTDAVLPLPASPRPATARTLLPRALAVATVLGCSSIACIYTGMNLWGRTYTLGRAVMAGLPDWYLWALATPLVFWLGGRFRIEKDRWLPGLCVHAAAGITIALAELAIVTAFAAQVGMASAAGPYPEAYLRAVLQYFHFNFMIYWVIVAAAHATRYYRSYREQELEASRLSQELVQAQLAVLQAQLQPHFLFNTLNTIASLIRDARPGEATDLVARLGDLQRESLAHGRRHEIALRDEIAFIDAYLDIERARFSDRLVVDIDVPPDTLDARLPSMALQPLVENAMRHGIARDPSARHLSVQARRHNGSLMIRIRNDGPAPLPRPAARRGLGLANVRARLHSLYGDDARLDLAAGDTGGAVATLEVPWRAGIIA